MQIGNDISQGLTVKSRRAQPTDYVLFGAIVVLFGLSGYFAHDPALRWPFVIAILSTGPLLYQLWKRDSVSIGHILFAAILVRLVVFPLLPSLSDDSFRYIWDGILVVDGINPYHYVPSASILSGLHAGELFQRLNSSDFYSVYPPISQYVFALGGLVYRGDWVPSYYVIKGFLLVAELAGLFILARFVSARSILLLSLNPVLIYASAGQGHTDAILVLLLGVGLVVAHRGKPGLGTALIAAAGWVKLYPFFILPPIWRRYGWKSLLISLVMIVIPAIPFAAPYVASHVGESLQLYVRYFEFNAGPYLAVKKLFLLATGEDWSKQLGPFFRMLFFVFVAGIYVFDWKFRPRLATTAVLIVAAFLLTATTVHPWYLIGILVCLAVLERPALHWQWLSFLAMGTYLLYVDGPYWPFVILGWVGALLIFVVNRWWDGFLVLQRIRSHMKARDLQKLVSFSGEDSILDLGAGEGYVSRSLTHLTGARVELMDVVDYHAVDLPFRTYDGTSIPAGDNAYDYTILYFVLHHCENDRTVLREALRVSSKGVLVVESVFRWEYEHRMLCFLDPLFNRLRSRGAMANQEEELLFRKSTDWSDMFRSEGAIIESFAERYHPIHRKAYFLLRPPAA